jgi:hypothetical protein
MRESIRDSTVEVKGYELRDRMEVGKKRSGLDGSARGRTFLLHIYGVRGIIGTTYGVERWQFDHILWFTDYMTGWCPSSRRQVESMERNSFR